MRVLDKKAFFGMFVEKGIVLDKRYAPPQTLVFKGENHYWRSWSLPKNFKEIPRFITRFVDELEAYKSYYMYPRVNAWKAGNSIKLFQQNLVLEHYDLQLSGDEVLEIDEKDRDAVETLIFLALIHGGTVSDDIFCIPDNGRVFMMADHHEDIRMEYFTMNESRKFEMIMKEYE